MDMPLYPGDPLTPGVGATADAKRLDMKDVKCSRKFLCCRFPMATRSRCWRRLAAPWPRRSWRGALRITYHVGPGPAKVHLKVKVNWDMKPINDIIATIPGSSAPDEWVIRGNHYDAWVNGAEDPDLGHFRGDGRGASSRRTA